MQMVNSLTRFLLAIEAGRTPTYKDTSARMCTDKMFTLGYLSAVQEIAYGLGLCTDPDKAAGPQITDAGHEYLWSHSDPAWCLLEIDTLTVAS